MLLLAVKVQKLGELGDVSVSYRAPVGYKVGKQTVIVASDFVLLRKGRTEIYINVTGPSNDEAADGSREADREGLLRPRSRLIVRRRVGYPGPRARRPGRGFASMRPPR